jgi:hypothetical protein
MLQVGALVMAACLLIGGVKALLWAEKPEFEISRGIAVLMIVVAILLIALAFSLAVFVLVFLPTL